MINKWILNNFKSIDREKELEFRPLTIFTGANSSGKSTILQSILLVTQTLQSPIASRSIVLNGWFKKFGSYSDIVNQKDYNKNVEIGFSLLNNVPMRYSHYYSPWSDEIRSVGCKFEVSAHCDEDLQPFLNKLEMKSEFEKSSESQMTITKDDSKSDKERKIIDSNKGKTPDIDFGYKIDTDFDFRRRYYGATRDLTPLGVGINHFLPNYMVAYYNRIERFKEYLRMMNSSASTYSRLDSAEEMQLISIIKEKAKKIIEEISTKELWSNKKKSERQYKKLEKDFTLDTFFNYLRNTTLSSEEREKKFLPMLYEEFKKIGEDYGIDRVPMFFFPGIEFVNDYFHERIKYLGPLREEPKALYPLESNDTMTDVGLKGENTAAVYDNNKGKKIEYIDPNCFKDLQHTEMKATEGTLSEAINKWLVYLGVAQNIDTRDKGKMGHELKITTDVPNMEQDLTHVGVGVSQVLPILVMSFLAKPGAVIILEQPELHLHPKVQTRLADFFVAMNSLQKQCIIETHSEYLINRLRYLVAMSDSSKVAEDTMIYFVEKEDGHSKYRQVTINPYGVIEDWPEGFFDESEKIAAEVLRAGMEKKMKENNEDYEE